MRELPKIETYRLAASSAWFSNHRNGVIFWMAMRRVFLWLEGSSSFRGAGEAREPGIQVPACGPGFRIAALCAASGMTSERLVSNLLRQGGELVGALAPAGMEAHVL